MDRCRQEARASATKGKGRWVAAALLALFLAWLAALFVLARPEVPAAARPTVYDRFPALKGLH